MKDDTTDMDVICNANTLFSNSLVLYEDIESEVSQRVFVVLITDPKLREVVYCERVSITYPVNNQTTLTVLKSPRLIIPCACFYLNSQNTFTRQSTRLVQEINDVCFT